MKVRIISALVGIVVLVGILLIPSPMAVVAMCSFLAAIATYELLHNTGVMTQKSLLVFSMAFAALEIPLCCCMEYFRFELLQLSNPWQSMIRYLPLAVLGVYVLSLLVHIVVPGIRVTLESAQYAFLLTLYATVGFGSVAMMRQIRNVGWWLVVVTLVIAWMSDTGAYFVGVLLGKHKMAPKISPKKSWEGFFGGWIISVLCAVLVFIIRFETEHSYGDNVFFTLYVFLPLVVVLAPLSVCGDLLASAIKRKCGIKDFGNIMPGHGGVMDRFDSVIFIAPLLYLFVSNYGIISHYIAEYFF